MRAVHAAAIAMTCAGICAAVACMPRPRMCGTSGDCGPSRACVAGRCQIELVDAGATPEIQTTRRIVLAPVDVAFLRRGEGPTPALPTVFSLGRQRDGDAILLLKFAAPLTPKTKVVEAYVLLDRAEGVDVDPTPIYLHAARVVAPWDSRSTSWASLPSLEEARSPSTAARADGPSLVRVDVRELVRQWASHEKRDNGLAIVAEGASATGIAFSMVRGATPVPERPPQAGGALLGDRAASDAPTGAEGQLAMPRLELYVK